MRKAIFISYFLFFISYLSFGQRFGGNPPSLKWKQLNTDTARIIFPVGLDSQAQRAASLVHYLAANKPVALGDKLYKINIVLQNQTTIANAYVALGPYRSEFFINPALNNFDEGTIPWVDQLAIHEYRHVQQFNNFRTGLSKLMYILFGDDGYSLAINASIPDWFYEGDAVYNETILSSQGRGRVPLFLDAYPSLWMAGKKYSWMKLRNGSLKDYVPNHYYLGYLLVNYGREKYGLDFWSKVTRDAAAFKGLFYPFQKAVKTHAGVNYKTFYREAFEYYKRLTPTLSKEKGVPNSMARNISKVNTNVVTNYLFPYSISPDSLLYLKTSYNRRPAFYIKDNDGEHRLRVRDIAVDDQFSYRNGKIVYAAYESDPRWGWRDYSVIRIVDVKTKEQHTVGGKKGYHYDASHHFMGEYEVSPKARYFTPDISADGLKIAAVRVSTNGKNSLHILDATTGTVIKEIQSGEIALFTDPKFIDDKSVVFVARLKDGRAALARADIASGNIERLTPASYNVAGFPCVDNDLVYFTASYGGNDDVFALRLSDKKLFKISHGPLGNYFVNAANGKITWSAFTAEGYQLQQADEKDIQWTPVSEDVAGKMIEQFPVSHEQEVHDVLLNTPPRDFVASKYSKGTGFFNFHSWRPYYEDPEFTFSLYGENILNTTQTEIYYLYNKDDKTNAAGFNFTYGAWFPYLSTGTQYTFNRQQVISNKLRQWDELNSRVGFSIPLSWASGKTFNQVNFGSSYVYRNDFNKGVNKDLFTHFHFSYLSHFISVGQQTEMVPQHIYPKLGYAITFSYLHAITNYKSWQPLVTGSFYLPGIFPSHSLVITAAFQETDTLNALFSNRFPYSRGYNVPYFSRMERLSGNYHFPIVYPDFGIANILYLQRIRGNVFFDFTRVFSLDKKATADQRSVGGEIYVDTKWWNQYPLTFGFRVSHLLDNDFYTHSKGTVYEFILPVSILPK
ncbi:MAG: hypothetical protein Q8941_11225 [Bacteroidota bacterium]|nr:hypothetical protein [Bacteroidota bacterium]